MRRATFIILFFWVFQAVCHGQSLTVFSSSWSVLETARRVENSIYAKPVNKLESIEHFNSRTKTGAPIDSVIVLPFEDPSLTIELLSCEPTAALDLPLQIIVWKENGDVYLGFMDPYFMKKRYMIKDCEDTIDKMTRLLLRIVNETIRSN